MGYLGVTEWENLGYKDSDMMGRAGNHDARSFWQADMDEAIGRLVFLVRTFKPDVMTTYNDFGGYGHPDHIRTHLVAVGAFARAGDPSFVSAAARPRSTAAPAHRRRRAGSRHGPPPSSTSRRSPARCARGCRSGWRRSASDRVAPPRNATPEQVAEFEALIAAKMLVPDEAITAKVDVREVLDARWDAIKAHVTQISDDNPFVRFGKEAWAEYWPFEAYVRRESRIWPRTSESDLRGASMAGSRAPPVGTATAVAGGRGRGHAATKARATRGRRPSDASQTWSITNLPNDPAGSRKFACALPRMMCGRIRAWTRSLSRNVELQREALHRVLRPGLVEHEVAQAVPDRLPLVDLHPLGPVGMVADHHVGAGVDGRPAEPLLRCLTGSARYSIPQCGNTTTTSAPASRVGLDVALEVGLRDNPARCPPCPRRRCSPGRSRRSRATRP